MIEKLAILGSIILPMFNIPLIKRIIDCGSSDEVSLLWAFGVWGSLALMLPQGLVSKDPVWKAFTVVNFVLFTGVVITVLLYRKKRKH